ncbi:MAG: hypothetical protein JWQ66_4680 [Mucilaginibacter sp.]|nr:hypothetical protein [Mucilaginibacter sp.]
MKSKEIPRALLALLFAYAACSKLLDLHDFRRQMQGQVFSPGLNRLLVYLIPLLEIAAVVLLSSKKLRYAGCWLSFGLMAAFTGYVSLVLLHFWSWVPCSCGGILGGLSWGPHLVLNVVFLLLTIVAIYLETKERRAGDGP